VTDGTHVTGVAANVVFDAGTSGAYFGTPSTTSIVVATDPSTGVATAMPTLGSAATTYNFTATVQGVTPPLSTPLSATGVASAPTFISKIQGDAQNGTAGAPLFQSLIVQVSDQNHDPFQGTNILTFSVSGNGSVNGSQSGTLSTDKNGLATFTFVLDTTPGAQTVTVTIGAGGSSAVFNETGFDPTTLTLNNVSGGGQSGNAGAALNNPLIVQVLSGTTPICGATVTFAGAGPLAPANPGSFDQAGGVYTTDLNGNATALYTLSTDAGTNAVTASLALTTQTVPFTETGVAGAAAIIFAIDSTNNQSYQPGFVLPQPLTVKVVDGTVSHNAVASVSVSFATKTGSGLNSDGKITNQGGTPLTSPQIVKTDSNGLASVYFKPGSIGDYEIDATATGLSGSPVQFFATGTQVPTTITKSDPTVALVSDPTQNYPVSGDNQVQSVLTTLATQFSVVVKDLSGNPVAGVTVTFQVDSNADANFGSPTMKTATDVTDSDGIAQAQLSLGATPGSLQVSYSATQADGKTALTTPDGPFHATSLLPANINYYTLGGVDLSGNNQSGGTNDVLPNQLIAQVTDGSGIPVPGVSIVWAVTFQPGGTLAILAPELDTTDGSGLTHTTLTLGSTAGALTITASAVNPVTKVELLNGSTNTNVPLAFNETATTAISFWVAPKFKTTTLATTTTPLAPVIMDMNGDSTPDLVVAESTAAKVAVLTGDGNGGLNSALEFSTGSNPLGVAVGVFRAPTTLLPNPPVDIATVSRNGGKRGRGCVSVLLQKTSGTFGFANPVKLTAGKKPSAIAVADLDGDGNLDIVVTNSQDNTVTVFLGLGTGGFRNAGAFTCGKGPLAVAIQDLKGSSGNGLPDIVTANGGTAGVSILLNTTTNNAFSLAAHTDVTLSSKPQALAIGQLHAPGVYDIVTANGTANTVSFLKGNGSGGYTHVLPDVATGGNPSGIAIADVDGDGNLDVVVSNKTDGTASVLLNDGKGTFTFLPRVDYFAGAGGTTGPSGIAFGDLGPGGATLPAAIVTNSAENDAYVLLGVGNGILGSRIVVTTAAGPDSVVATHLNGDAQADLVVANGTGNSFTALVGNGRGGFSSSTSVSTSPSTGCASACVADFDGDGIMDVAVVCSNTTPEVLIAYGDGSGGFSATKTLSTGGTSKCVSIVAGDFDNDGHMDIAMADSTGNILVWFGDGKRTTAFPVTGQTSIPLSGNTPVAIAAGNWSLSTTLSPTLPSLAVACPATDLVLVFPNPNDGTRVFGAPITLSTGTGSAPAAVSVIDIDGNANPDLAVACSGSFGASANCVQLYSGNGDGTFTFKFQHATGTTPTGIVVGLLSNDTVQDVAVLNTSNNSTSVFLGTGQSDLGTRSDFATGTRPNSGTIADFTGDNKPDLVIADQGSKVVILIQK
jgi:hypothetical protein